MIPEVEFIIGKQPPVPDRPISRPSENNRSSAARPRLAQVEAVKTHKTVRLGTGVGATLVLC
jgi:hypothetical protein